MDQVVYLIWRFILRHDNWVTVTHIPDIFNEEVDTVDTESRKLIQSRGSIKLEPSG